MNGGAVRGSIPASVRKTIQNIREITRNHSEEEIYAMLKECSMDPNETAQRLLLQGLSPLLLVLLLLLSMLFALLFHSFLFSFSLPCFLRVDLGDLVV